MIVLYAKSLILIQAEMPSKNKVIVTDVNRMCYERCLRSSSVSSSIIKRKVAVDFMQCSLQNYNYRYHVNVIWQLFASFICYLTHPFVNQGYHDIDLDTKLNQKLRNRKDLQTISGTLIFLLKMTCGVQSVQDTGS